MSMFTLSPRRSCWCPLAPCVLALAVLLSLAVPMPEARAAMTLDQQHLLDNGGISFDDTQLMAQTFTPGITGQLARIDVKAWSEGGYPATISIQTVTDSMPDGTVLGSVDIASWTPSSWHSADFLSQSIWLTAGQQYAMVFSGIEPDAFNTIATNWLHADAYAGGQVWAFWWSGAESWVTYGNDTVFQTWMVTENVIPAPGAIVLASIGMVALAHLRRRRLL